MDNAELKYILQNTPVKWRYRMFPFLPRCVNNKDLRLLTISWRDCSYTVRSVSKKHFFDILLANHASPWYKPKLVGIQIWY